MLSLNSTLSIPAHVLYTRVDQDNVLLNTRTNKYYALNEVGARFWNLLVEGKTLREAQGVLLGEFEVEPSRLEEDLLELIEHLRENGLIETIEP